MFNRLPAKSPLFRLGPFCVLLLAIPQSSAAAAQGSCDPSLSYAITDTTIIDVALGRARAHQSIVLKCGRITAVGSAHRIKVPANVPTMDGKGLFAAPGLVDAHAHNTSTESFRKAYLAYGITTVRNMSGDAASLEAISQVRSGKASGPWVYLASPIINGSEPEWQDRDAFAAAGAILSKAKESGEEYAKAYYQLTPAQFEALALTSARLKMPLVGHVPRSVTLDVALKRMWSVEHLTGFDDALEDPARHVDGKGSAMLSLRRFAAAARSRIPVLASQVAHSGSWQIPTLYSYDVWARPAEMRRLSSDHAVQGMIGEEMLRQWTSPNPWYVTPLDKQTDADRAAIAGATDVRRLIVKALYDAGAKLAIGTDAGAPFVTPGSSFHQEMKIYSEIGIPAPAILRMATLQGARVAGHEADAGTIEPGKRADILLLRANPLKDLRTLERPAAVIAAGHYFARAKLNEFAAVSGENELPSAY